jgi:hypothetical protein
MITMKLGGIVTWLICRFKQAYEKLAKMMLKRVMKSSTRDGP